MVIICYVHYLTYMVSVETTIRVLRSLAGGEKFTRQLLEEFGDFSIHKVLKHCERKGFVRRMKRPKDKRLYNAITRKGMDILQQYEFVIRELE